MALDWLIARPIAHRGLHDPARGIVENTATAINAAIENNYAIEIDLQISADGEAMVHHDHELGRLTDGRGELARLLAAELKRVAFKQTSDRMMTLGDLCDLVRGRVTMAVELKSRFDGDFRVAERAAEVLRTYRGPVAVMSFDPALVECLRTIAPALTRGIDAELRYDHPEWSGLSKAQRRSMAHLLHAPQTRPQFVSYAVNDLPALAPWVARTLFGAPVLAWTVRTDEQRRRAARWADQVIFEGFRA